MDISCASTDLDEFPVEVLATASSVTGLYQLRLRFEKGRLHGGKHQPKAGQFFMLDVQDPAGFRLRRPYSLMSWNPHTQEGLLVFKVVGEGSQVLSQWRVGQRSIALSPLGRPFPEHVKTTSSSTLLLAGGVGVAPLALWAEEGFQVGWNEADMPTLVYGVKNKAEAEGILPHLKGFMPAHKLIICTDDGSLGWHGHVGTWLAAQSSAFLSDFQNVFSCGPTPMMHHFVEHIPFCMPQATLYVSLENHMPCGTGACFACVVGQSQGRPPIKVCEEGPVFEASQLSWLPIDEGGPPLPSGTSAHPAVFEGGNL